MGLDYYLPFNRRAAAAAILWIMKTRPPIYTRYYDLLGWILDRVSKFPKHTRFGLVQKIAHIALDTRLREYGFIMG